MKEILWQLYLTLTSLTLLTTKSKTLPDIPELNLTFPVKVVFEKGGIASGFFIRENNVLYFITARHVLLDYDVAKQEFKVKNNKMNIFGYSKRLDKANRFDLMLDPQLLYNNQNINYHETHDVAVIQIANYNTNKPIPGVDVIRQKESVTFMTGDEAITFDQVLISNPVYLFGYPESLGSKTQGPSPEFDKDLPLLRSGIVAGINKDIKNIVIDCPSYKGNSGGPVVMINRGTPNRGGVIGVVSMFIPLEELWINDVYGYANTTYSNSGYTIVEPIDFVFELINQP